MTTLSTENKENVPPSNEDVTDAELKAALIRAEVELLKFLTEEFEFFKAKFMSELNDLGGDDNNQQKGIDFRVVRYVYNSMKLPRWTSTIALCIFPPEKWQPWLAGTDPTYVKGHLLFSCLHVEQTYSNLFFTGIIPKIFAKEVGNCMDEQTDPIVPHAQLVGLITIQEWTSRFVAANPEVEEKIQAAIKKSEEEEETKRQKAREDKNKLVVPVSQPSQEEERGGHMCDVNQNRSVPQEAEAPTDGAHEEEKKWVDITEINLDDEEMPPLERCAETDEEMDEDQFPSEFFGSPQPLIE